MKRIVISDDDGKTWDVGKWYIHWLIEDCDDCFWCIASETVIPRQYMKSRFQWKESEA